MTDIIGKFNETKPGNSEIVYCKYVPVQLTEEEWERREKMKRAGKTYAKVKRSNPNPAYRCKRGQVVEKSQTGYCLEIETMNTTNEEGFSTLIGVTYPHGYSKIWFDHDEVEDFESYDENGELVKIYNSDLSLNYEELDKLQARIAERLDERGFGDFERDVQHLILAVSKLKDEKDACEEKYYNLADRYMKYLDRTNEELRKLIKT